MLKAIIFDMDGVLVKSTGVSIRSFSLVLKKYGVKLNTENWGKYLGRSLRDQLEMWKKEYPNIPKDLSLEEFSKEAFEYQLDIFKNILLPDNIILNLINKAKSINIKIAVATSSTRYRAETLLEHIGVLGKLDVLVTAEDVINHKPSPDVFLVAAKRINISPKYCVVIEDAVNGIHAANNAGMKSVALVNKNYSREDFYMADYVFSDFKDLKLDYLENLF